MSAVPGDPAFSQFNNHYDVASYKRLWREFGVDPSSDFRFTHGAKSKSIEVFVYCILGAHLNVRSSILDSGGRAKEAQSEFLVLMEDAIRQPDLAKSVQRYQLAVDDAKVRFNLAVAPMAWLMPAQMVINTESTVDYNNKLKQAVSGIKLGVNNEVNPGTTNPVLRHMAGGPSKINRPNSHPSNPIHKAATAESKKPASSAQPSVKK